MAQNFGALNYYDILGVSRDATVDEIKKAYKKAALTHHPDKGGDSEKFKECGAAVETLTDERKRSAYDSSLLRARSRDGLRFGGGFGSDRDTSADRGHGSWAQRQQHAYPPQQERGPSGTRPPQAAQARPPRPPAGAVEIPADPSSLSIKELKELLTALGIDHEGCLEKADLLAQLRNRKESKRGGAGGDSAETTPRTGPAGSSASRDNKPTTPRPAPKQEPSSSAQPETKGGRALRVKVMSLGSAGVGKSTLIKRYCEGRFVQKYITTIGIDYGVKPVKVLGQDVKVNFFDTSGGDEFKEIRVEFYEMGETGGFLLVYDVTTRQSFTELEGWLNEANRHKCPISKQHKSGEAPFVILCANKVDLPKRVVARAEGEDFASRHGMQYFETSAATGDSVVEAMTYLFEKMARRHLDDRKRLGAG